MDVKPFTIDIPQAVLDDLGDRLARMRWPDQLPGVGWTYGVPLDFVKDVTDYWRSGYDWRAWEARLNGYPQFTTTIDGQNIHFLHVRSPEPNALPLIVTHGWPATIVEYLDLIGQLTDPRAHGGDPAQAFDLVIPSIPGFAFSGPTHDTGWDSRRIARAWAALMQGLGYTRYGAHGNDAGSIISPEVGRCDPEHVVGVHVTQVFSFPSGDPAEFEGLSEEDFRRLNFLQHFNDTMTGFSKLQSTQPQTLAYALSDSPVGQLAWSSQLLGEAVSRDFLITNALIYWLTGTAGSSARIYYEDAHAQDKTAEPTTVPLGVAVFANDFQSIRRFAERDHQRIVHWSEFERGSHWSAQDAPELLLNDLRIFFAPLRANA